MSLKVYNKPLNDLSVDEWKVILEHGSYRGYKINRLAEALSTKKVDALSYNIGKGTVSFKESNKEQYTLDLNRIKRCPSKWSLSRLSYWLKKLFGVNQSKHNGEISHLAQCIYDKLHSTNVSVPIKKSEEFPPGKTFPSQDMVLIKNALIAANKGPNDPEVFQMGEGIDSEMYAIWFNSKLQSIEVQKASEFAKSTSNEKVSFGIDGKGQITTLFVDGNKLNEIKGFPKERQVWLQEGLKKAIDLVSSYGLSGNKKFIEIKTIRRGIRKAPLVHLNKLGDEIQNALKHKKHPRMDVNLLKNDLSKAKGSDNGGLARDYLNLVMASTIQEGGLPFQSIHPTGLFLPSAKHAGDELFSLLSGEEMTVYQNLGKVMMYCYRSKPNTEDFKNNEYIMGQHFHESLFAGALSLNVVEINTSFESLGIDTKFKMCKGILIYLGHTEWTKFLDWKAGDPIPQFDNEALQFADAYLDEMTCAIDRDRVDADPEAFMDYVKKNLLNFPLGQGTKGTGVTLCSLLAPVHAVAQGLKAVRHSWNAFQGMDCIKFSNKVQGSLDRNAIVKAFTMLDSPNAEVNKKIGWLKEWIQNEITSDKALRAFLVYMTGANALPNGQKLYYGEQSISNLVPTGITCKFLLLLSPITCSFGEDTDGTKEGFINIIQKYIVNDTSNEITQD